METPLLELLKQASVAAFIGTLLIIIFYACLLYALKGLRRYFKATDKPSFKQLNTTRDE